MKSTKPLPYIMRNPIPQIKSNGLKHQAHSRTRKANQEWERAINLKMQRGR
jgi:hypothetical protein